MGINKSVPGTKNSVQNNMNWSFDEDFGINAVELVGHDANADVLRRVAVDADGNFNITATVSGADGAILDGVDSGIKATVKDLTNSNPLTVALVDSAGTQLTSTGGKLDVTASIDTTGLATTTTDTNTGTIAGDTTSIDGKIPALGQALAASSVPVVLTAAQVTTLTPPAAITGFATEAKQLPDGHNVTVDNSTGADAVNIQDGGNTITVDGAVTTSGTVTEASAADIKTAVQLIDNAVSGTGFNISQVNGEAIDVGAGTEAAAIRVTLPTDGTGKVTAVSGTAANMKVEATIASAQTLATVTTITNDVGIKDNGNTITVDNGGTFAVQAAQSVAANLNCTEASASAIKTAVEVIDNCISGSEAQVDVVAALPAGTNALGKLLPPDIDITTHTNYIKKYYTNAGAVTDGIIWSPAAGKRWHITTLYINTSAAATITLEDDLAGGDSAVWKGEIGANSGVVIPFSDMYPLASGEDAADLIITTSAGNVYCTVTGYEI